MFSPVEAQYFYPNQVATRSGDGIGNRIFSGVMTLVIGIVTMVRLTRNMPRKLTEATLYSSSMGGGAEMMKGQGHPHKLPSPAISHIEYLNMMKRISELEEKVIHLSQKPVSMPPDKEEMLNAALARVDNLEQQLSATNKVSVFHSFCEFMFNVKKDLF